MATLDKAHEAIKSIFFAKKIEMLKAKDFTEHDIIYRCMLMVRSVNRCTLFIRINK